MSHWYVTKLNFMSICTVHSQENRYFFKATGNNYRSLIVGILLLTHVILLPVGKMLGSNKVCNVALLLVFEVYQYENKNVDLLC